MKSNIFFGDVCMQSYFHNTCLLIQNREPCIFYIIVLYTHYIVFLYKLTNKTCVYINVCICPSYNSTKTPNALCISKYITVEPVITTGLLRTKPRPGNDLAG